MSLYEKLDAIASSETDNFVELAHAAGLDPATDFVGLDMRWTDLSDCRFNGWNFSGADFRGATFNPHTDFTGAIVDGAKFDAGLWEVLKGLRSEN